jgi:hypothetical protein
MAVFGAVWIPDDKERLVGWIRDVDGFRKAADLGLSRKLSSTPAINDFGELVLDARELQASRAVSPGTARSVSAIGRSRDSRPRCLRKSLTRA